MSTTTVSYNPINALTSCLKRYAKFEGRACRSEFWYWTLSTFIIGFVIGFVGVLTVGEDVTNAISNILQLALLLPGLAVAFGYSIFAHYQIEKSMTREIELMKQAAKKAPAKASPSPAPSHINLLRTVLLLAAIILLVVGYFTGGTGDVLTKAINICTECVGLG
jgi:hypothetical protein